MTNKNIHKIFTALSFIIPLVIYILTMAPTTSFWDCGEYIATSRILGVPHPPGSPLFLLLGNVFSNIPIFQDIGARVNLISPIASALSVMFLYLIIVYLIEEYRGKTKSLSDIMITNCSAFIAALTFAVTDSHWFNAVEAEVYSVSTFFTAIVAWMILKWSKNAEDNWNIKYLLIIVYMFGLAIGVHLLNLLTLPFVALIIYFKKFNYSHKTFFITICATLLSFIIIYLGIIKGIPDITSKTGNLFFTILFPLIIVISIVINLIPKIKKNIIHSISGLSITVISILLLNSFFINSIEDISYKKYDDLVNMQTKIDDADKEIYKLNNSLQTADQYQSYDIKQKINNNINQRNLIVENYKSVYDDYLEFEESKNQMSFFQLILWQSKINLFLFISCIFFIVFMYLRFSKINFKLTQSFTNFFFTSILLIFIGYSTYVMIFIRSAQHPAINENSPDTIDRALAYMNRDQYGDWSIIDRASTIARPENTNWRRYTLDKKNPTKMEQFNFFVQYQINEMYLRYFAWQFIGRGEKENYPWHIKDLDGNLIGNQNLDGINWLRYGLPFAFIIGLIGLIFHFSRDWKRALAVLSFFLATGLMIIIYLNQYDPQPRERDYSFVASFFAFSIWIGIGLSIIQSKIRTFFEDTNVASFISASCLTFVLIFMPIRMLAVDYKEHNRSGNYVAWDYGYNLLNSCEPNGIIFTNGDNDTFPLWYLQEVEGLRKDVKVVNLSLLNTAWYIDQLMYQEPKLDLNFNNKSIIEDIYNLDPWVGTEIAFELCGNNFDNQNWNQLDCNLSTDENNLNFKIRPTLIGKLLRLQDALILQIIHDVGKEKPIYFAATVSPNNQMGLEQYLQMEGMTYRLLFDKKQSPINYNKMKQNLTQANPENIIMTSEDYIKAINSGEGIYRYTNLNDTSIYFNSNIKRLVQNYRIGFIRLAEEKINNKGVINELEVETFMDAMNNYFPNEILPIEPGILMLISDSIYGAIGNQKEQRKILLDLIENNIPLETKIYLLHKIAEMGNDKTTIDMTFDLIKKHDEELHFDLQKYIGDILSDYLEAPQFIDFCDSLFMQYKYEGILYSFVRVMEEQNSPNKAYDIVKEWLNKDPQNERLLLLDDYLSNFLKLQ